MIATADLFWAAGFLDGEGCFSKSRRCPSVTAAQKDRWPLDRLLAVLGGHVYQDGRGFFLWAAHGSRAAGIMMTLYTLLSPRRQGRIAELLAIWKATPARGDFNRSKTHCKHGHAFTPENTYLKADGSGRSCRQCQKDSNARYLQKEQS